MANVCVFDTETIGTEKAFCYNIGFVIFNTESGEILVAEDYVVEQIWNNKPLFETAYYADKKEIYISRMRGGSVKMKKFGHITQRMAYLFRHYEVECAYAYNSPFDDRVFRYNCDWFHCINPFDNIKIIDIRGLVHKFIAFTPAYQQFCEENGLFTESGNYSTTAEALFKYIIKSNAFEEEHTALADSMIEKEILTYCVNLGGQYGLDYKVYRSVPYKKERKIEVFRKGEECNELVYAGLYKKKRTTEDVNGIKIVLD